MNKKILLSLGNLYVETNYLGVESAGSDILEVGKEYSAPKYETRLGGSAVNFITQSKKFGLDVGIIGKSGNDDAAKTLFELFEKEEIRTDLIKKSDKYITNVDTGLVLSHSVQNIQIVAGSANQSLSIKDIDFDAPIFKNVGAVYFGGAFKQKLLWPDYPNIFKMLANRNIKLFLDPGRVPVDADSNWVDILKDVLPFTSGYFPNDKEISTVTGMNDIKSAIKKVTSWGSKITVVKIGSEGCLVSNNGEINHVNGYKVEAVNTVGAGDCFNAAFIYQMLLDKPLFVSAKFANASAALRVSKNVQPNLEDVDDFLKKH
jgi:ribokinase